MVKVILPLLILLELASASELCSLLFNPVLSTREKATEINHSNGKGVFNVVGEGFAVPRELDDAPDTANVMLKFSVRHGKKPAEMAFGSGPAVVGERLQKMLELGLKENYEIELATKTDKRDAKLFDDARRFSFADTAVTKHQDVGYMWMGVIMEFRPGEYIEFRLQVSLHNKEHVLSQKQSVGTFGINLLHGLMKIKDFENLDNINNLLNELTENLKSGEIKINDFFIDRLAVKEGMVKGRVPLLHDSVRVTALARTFFKKNLARSLIIDNYQLTDPPQVSFRRNIIVKTNSHRDLGKILNLDNLKTEFEKQAATIPPQEKPPLFMVALEDVANVESVIARLNSVGIAVWLFKPNGGGEAKSKSLNDLISAKRSYIESFSGRLYTF